MIVREEISIQKRYLVVDATTNWKFVFSDGDGVNWFQGRYEVDLYKHVADSRSIQRPYIEWDDSLGAVVWQVSDVSVGELSGVNGQLVSVSNPFLEVKVINAPDVNVASMPGVSVVNTPGVNVVNQPNVGVVSMPAVNVASISGIVSVKNTNIASIRVSFNGTSNVGMAVWNYFVTIRELLGYSASEQVFAVKLYGYFDNSSIRYHFKGNLCVFQQSNISGTGYTGASGSAPSEVVLPSFSNTSSYTLVVEYLSQISYG
jgi:hypothetical protein